MNRLIYGTALAGFAVMAPMAAQAQQLPPPVIAVVNVERIGTTCTQCAVAAAQLQTQGTTLQQRAQQLQGQVEAEGRAIQPLYAAVPQGAQPDAALTTRIQNYRTMQQNAQRELAAGEQRLARNAEFVEQQIGQRISTAVNQVMQQRGATVAIDRRILINASPTLDITDAVLAIVNQNAAPVNVNAPPPPQQPAAAAPGAAQPQPAQPNRPRPQGR